VKTFAGCDSGLSMFGVQRQIDDASQNVVLIVKGIKENFKNKSALVDRATVHTDYPMAMGGEGVA